MKRPRCAAIVRDSASRADRRCLRTACAGSRYCKLHREQFAGSSVGRLSLSKAQAKLLRDSGLEESMGVNAFMPMLITHEDCNDILRKIQPAGRSATALRQKVLLLNLAPPDAGRRG